eukprot:CAMPEP_0185295530 /NCGR_PEP_ID=MMETSP1363-20130426/8414_1 /TAXON_ID=38817 /ORGANISM="Gephyrocapsa oceanica, Strain RCC1303" /LENGTH=218 /DNA_ID=CAMNT_0027892091 /DNA_START=69 /DNA_END=723 /DNA_ORIENTATION=-
MVRDPSAATHHRGGRGGRPGAGRAAERGAPSITVVPDGAGEAGITPNRIIGRLVGLPPQLVALSQPPPPPPPPPLAAPLLKPAAYVHVLEPVRAPRGGSNEGFDLRCRACVGNEGGAPLAQVGSNELCASRSRERRSRERWRADASARQAPPEELKHPPWKRRGCGSSAGAAEVAAGCSQAAAAQDWDALGREGEERHRRGCADDVVTSTAQTGLEHY